MSTRTQKIKGGILILLVLVLVLTTSLLTADYLRDQAEALSFIAKFGYIGVTGLATIAGLNVIVPIPAASFVPIFTEAGLWLPGIILCLTIGTIIADFLGFAFGRWSRTMVIAKYPEPIRRLESLYTKHRGLLPYIIFLYAAFMPFPNEAIILPLAVLGMPFRIMLIPLFLGNLVNQTIFSYGIQNIFQWLF